MEVAFRSRRLQRRYERSSDAIRAWGPEVGKRYVQRVSALVAAESVADLFTVRAFDFHPLTGDRAGQYALRLTGQVRLIVTVESNRQIIIEEVTDYHA